MYLYHYLAIIICFCIVAPIEAQIEVSALDYNHVIRQAKKNAPLQKRSVPLDTLPFVDDFALEGAFPITDRWENDQVFVNQSLAIDPPSIGVATFDGLDNTGSPYGRQGSGDTLTSVAINLDNIAVNDLYISYFVQPKGFGDQPELTDSLLLEFKDAAGSWILQKSYTGKDGFFPLDSVKFTFDFVEIKSLGFIHDDFQFRFRNKSSGKGAVDLWHLDMIRIYNNQVPTETFKDLAFQYPSEGILNRYTAMPINQFGTETAQHLRSEFNLDIFNHFDVGRPIGSDNSLMEIRELNTGQLVSAPSQFLTVQNLDIGPNQSLAVAVQKEFSVPSSLTNEEHLLFETTFIIDPVVADNDPGLLDNNFIRTRTVIDDYYAYDDGVAELRIAAKGGGSHIAVEFQAYTEETLSAIEIHFPRVNRDVSDQFFNLKVWQGSLETEPVFIGEILNPIYVDNTSDTLQGFTTYRLQESFTGILQPVDISPGPFFIGWEQVTDEFENAIPVGYDLNASGNVGRYNHFSSDGENWVSLESLSFTPEGAIMIRPVMGVENAINTSIDNKVERNIGIYPNPTTGRVNIKIPEADNFSTQIYVYDLQGRAVHEQVLNSEDINLSFLSPGIYFINLVNETNHSFYHEKLIIH